MTSMGRKSAHILKTMNRQIFTSRKCSQNDLVILDVNDKTGVAILTLNRPPINALNKELLTSIRSSLEQVERNNCRGLILTSSLRSVFSAGLDIQELYKPDKDRLRVFWSDLQDVALRLSTMAMPVTALINGHAPAGGCLIATCCEYRVMIPNYTIGLNEVALGLAPPKWVVGAMLEILPKRVTELAITQGKLFLTEEALKVGLIDEIASDKEEGLARCEKFFDTFKSVNPSARAQTKNQFRVNDLHANRDSDLESFTGYVTQPDVQDCIGVYLQNLRNKSRK